MEKVFFVKTTHEPIYVQLYTAIVAEIHEGSLKRDEKLPSVRNLSKTMNISKTTVENAYNQLLAEGYVYSKPQVGYFVMAIETKKHRSTLTEKAAQDRLKEEVHSSKHRAKFDFVSEYVEPANFDLTLWKRNINYVLSHEEISLFSASWPFGEEILRTEICSYFSRTRGIKAEPNQIIINAGTSSLLRELTRVFKACNYDLFAIEDPGYNVAKEVFMQAEFTVRPIALKQNVLHMKAVRELGKSIIFTSPSFQFPYGEIMPVQTRYDLIEFAAVSDSYIIEDDYNNELRYLGRPVTSLQGMDTYGRVIYLGSFSTILLPSIKISFMVLPDTLLQVYNKILKDKTQGASKLEQLALGQMIKTGDFARHIRKLRKNYRNKYNRLLKLYEKHLSELCTLDLPPAGSMAILVLKKPISIKNLKVLSESMGVNLSVMEDFMMCNQTTIMTTRTLVLNYRGISDLELENGILRVKELLCQL
jgi:GntR family transcriptional regulator / MocR family aminotransferase